MRSHCDRQRGCGKGGGGNWRYYAGGNWSSPELELNDIGFLRQADQIQQYARVVRLFNKPTSWYRRMNFALEQSSAFDFEGNYTVPHEINPGNEELSTSRWSYYILNLPNSYSMRNYELLSANKNINF